MVSFTRIFKLVAFPVEMCATRAHNPGRVRENFMYRYCKENSALMQGGPVPLQRCNHCGMHMTEAQLEKNRRTARCKKSMEMHIRRIDMDMAERCKKMEFLLCDREEGVLLEGVAQFKCLGQPLDKNYDDWPELRRNGKREKRIWERLAKMLQRGRAYTKVS